MCSCSCCCAVSLLLTWQILLHSQFYRATQLCYSGLRSRTCNSVRPPVCLSHACFVAKPNNAMRICWYYTKGYNHTSFLTTTVVGGRRLIPSEICTESDPFLRKTPTSTDFRLGKNSIMTNRKSTGFTTSYRWSAHVTLSPRASLPDFPHGGHRSPVNQTLPDGTDYRG